MIDKVILFPYYAILKLRNYLYDSGIRKSVRAGVPTICVGNVAVGGTGKTPHTEMILRELLAEPEYSGKRIAVLSRGYKRESKGFQQVVTDGSAAMFGDEPLQIKKNFPDVTVAVCKDRVQGCDFLCHPEKLQKGRKGRKCWFKEMPPADLIILDDAFQYRRLKADLNIVLVDYNHPLHKDHLMPLGRLRDLPERVGEADIVIVTKAPNGISNWEKTKFAESFGVRDYDANNCTGTGFSGRKQTILFSCIEYLQARPIYSTTESRYIYSKRMILFSGIARDTPLRMYLSDYYKVVRHYSFPDHHRYNWADIQKLMAAVKAYPTAAVGTTEKDAQRVLDYNGMPALLKERLLMIPIKVVFATAAEAEIFRSRLRTI